jgi:hypothetical protein
MPPIVLDDTTQTLLTGTAVALALWPSHAPILTAGELSGLSRSAIYREAGAGKIRLVKLGRSTLVDMASVRAFLDSLPPACIAAPRTAA